MLEVSSTSKGILIPNVSLTGITNATTIASPAASLLVYNTANVSDIIPGYYYNSGTAISPVWSRLPTGTTSQIGTNTTNYLSKWNGSALVSSSIFDNGTNVGLGTPTPLKKMHVQSGGTSLLTSSYGDGVLFSSNSASGARIFLENLSGAENEKSLAIVNENVDGKGTTYFGSLSDNGNSWININILSMNHGTGNIGIGTAPTTEKLHVNGNVKVAGIISGVSDPINAQDAATKAYVDSKTSSPPTYSVGLLSAEQGGYIFWVSADGKHGLVAETVDQSSSSNWYNAQNIISDPSKHSANGKKFRDWRMPTKFELDEMWMNLQRFGCSKTIPASSSCPTAIGGFSGYYWSSTEADNLADNTAWEQDFFNGNQPNYGKGNSSPSVRAVRAF